MYRIFPFFRSDEWTIIAHLALNFIDSLALPEVIPLREIFKWKYSLYYKSTNLIDKCVIINYAIYNVQKLLKKKFFLM